MLPIGALVLWFVSSSAIIVVNKRLLVDEGFAYPLTLTGLSQFVSALGGAARVLACPAAFMMRAFSSSGVIQIMS